MKYSVSSGVLYDRLQNLERVVTTKNTIEIFSCLLFDVKGNIMEITSTDKEIVLRTRLELIESTGDCKFAIDARKFIDILKVIPDQPLSLEIDSSTFLVDLNYQNGHFQFQGENGEDFPIPDLNGAAGTTLQVDSGTLNTGLNTCLIAVMESGDSRQQMSGIFFDIYPENLSLVASDGHKLVCYRIACNTNDQESHFILPRKAAQVMKSILDKEQAEATIHNYDGHLASFETEHYQMNCTLIEKAYPNYRNVLLLSNPNIATIDRGSFISALRRVLVMTDKATELVKLQFNSNQLTFTTESINYTLSAEETMVCQYDGTPVKIGFKGSDLLDMANNLQSDEFMLKLSDASKAGLLIPTEQPEGTDLIMLLMPLLINN